MVKVICENSPKEKTTIFKLLGSGEMFCHQANLYVKKDPYGAFRITDRLYVAFPQETIIGMVDVTIKWCSIYVEKVI